MDRFFLRLTQAASVLVLLGFFAVESACGCSSKEKAYKAAIKSDLRNLVTAQSWHYGKHQSYTQSSADLDYDASLGVTVSVRVASDRAFAATGTHSQTVWECAIFVSATAEDSAPDIDGPVCWN